MRNQPEATRGVERAPAMQATIEQLREEVRRADEALQSTIRAREEFKRKNSGRIAELTRGISEAAAQVSSAEFIKLMPREEFFQCTVMDPEVLGADKYNALMDDEHLLSEVEKERATEARIHRIVEEATRVEERIENWNEEWMWFAKDQKEFEAQVEKIAARVSPTLTQLRTEFDANQRELGAELNKEKNELDKDKIARLKAEAAKLRGRIKTEEEKVEGEVTNKGLKAPKRPEQPDWETDTVRKALRNMRGTEELTNWYRYARPALNLKQLVATIMQGNWNEMRKSDKIDSAFKEQFRVDKRFYIQDAADYTLGLDPNIMDRWEKEDASAANALRKELNNDYLVKFGEDAYKREFFDGGKLTQMLRERMTEPLQARNINLRDGAPASERHTRFTAGMEMYKSVAPNLAANEFTLMPGILRKQYVVLRGLDHGTCAPFDDRDIEDTLPMTEFFIEEFKRELESQGAYKMSTGNLLILKWIVNEDRGQRFTKIDAIREDLKPTFEFIKGLIATTARSLKSVKYADEGEALGAIEEDYGRKINPFERIRKSSKQSR